MFCPFVVVVSLRRLALVATGLNTETSYLVQTRRNPSYERRWRMGTSQTEFLKFHRRKIMSVKMFVSLGENAKTLQTLHTQSEAGK